MAAPTLIFLGDSHTRGVLGADWVASSAAHARSRGISAVVRSGRDGEWLRLVITRLPPLLRRARPPNVAGVVLLAGSNDAIADLSPTMLRLYHLIFPRRLWRARPSVEQFEADAERAIALVAGSSASSSSLQRINGNDSQPLCPLVAVVTLPPLGEQLGSAADLKIREYNAALARVVQRHPERARLVDFYSACVRHLGSSGGNGGSGGGNGVITDTNSGSTSTSTSSSKRQGHSSAPPPPNYDPHNAPWQEVCLQLSAVLQRRVLRRKWDAIAARHGLRLLTDNVHLSDAAGALLERELRPFIDEVAARVAESGGGAG